MIPNISPELSYVLVLFIRSGVGLILLLLIYWRLRRVIASRSLGLLYLGAASALVLLVVLDGLGLLPTGLLRSLLLAALVLVWGYILFDLSESLVVERSLHKRGITVPRLARDIVRAIAVIALALLTINQIFGVSLNSLLISSTVLSAVLGLALQDLLKDMIAGIALQTERPYGPGDWLLLDTNQPARVIEMNWRATRLVTVDNTHLVVPNAQMALTTINNYSIVQPLQALHIEILLSPDHPPNQVKEALAHAAANAPGVLSDPPPAARLITYGEYSVTYDVKFWMADFSRYIETRDAVMTNIWYHMRRAGYRLPYPVRDIFVHESDAHTTRIDEAHRRDEIRIALRQVDLFAILSDDELDELVQNALLRIYGAGELLVRQGDRDDALFVIVQGRTRVEAAGPNNLPVRLADLAAGDIFGELALLTGEPRLATVTAIEDVQAVVVEREDLAPLLERNPSLPALLSEVLDRRLNEIRKALENNPATVAEPPPPLTQPTLLRRIRRMFGLS
ncbi:MAG: mechanosensitive ion channel [Oscillochloris sp.]|nr:mechanosensitive ion channel [Oscillochloris sp.]